MDKNRKRKRKIIICFIIFSIIAISCIAWITLLSNEESKVIIENANVNTTQFIQTLLLAYLAGTLIYLFGPFGMIMVGYIIYRIIKKRTIQKNTKHPKFDIEYFRDYLHNISPGCISYLIDFQVDIDRDVPAHLLKLQLDGYIEEQNGNFVVTQKDQTNLKESDKILLGFVNSNFTSSYRLNEYKYAIESEVVRDGYIEHTIGKNDIIKLASVFFFSPFVITICVALFSFVIESTSSLIIEFLIGAIIFLAFIIVPLEPIIFIIRLFTYIKWGRIRRTKAGNELLEKVYGLKNFLEDFTNIDDSRLNEIHLREYYLVYAVVLGINDEAGDDMLNKIKLQMKQNR